MIFSRITTSIIIYNLVTFGYSMDNLAENDMLMSGKGKIWYKTTSHDDL